MLSTYMLLWPSGGWSHAYYQLAVSPGSTYELSADLYAEVRSECDAAVAVTWCSPSIVVCPGKYDPAFYEIGGCYIGLAPAGNDKWESLVAEFMAELDAVTVYINQESTRYDSWLSNMNINLLQSSGAAPYLQVFSRTYLFTTALQQVAP